MRKTDICSLYPWVMVFLWLFTPVGFCAETHPAPVGTSPAAESPSRAPLAILGSGGNQEEPLPAAVAFPFSAEATDASAITVRWNMVPGYYLYRDKIHLQLRDAPTGIALAPPSFPRGEPKKDDEMGTVEIYRKPIEMRLSVHRPYGDAITVTLEAKFQGCEEERLCYPPQTRSVVLTLPPLAPTESARPATPPLTTSSEWAVDSEQDRVTTFLAHGNRLLVLAWFFGIGLLLAFTPCIFPMIPILSSIIVGQGKDLTTARAFSLSLVYVVAMASTYTVAGVVAGLVGTNLQTIFQDPWIIVTFSALFVALALSMFGLYELQLPAQLQAHLAALSNHQRGGTFVGVAIMGFLSALIVSPCVAPPLAGTLLYISQSGNAILGGMALFSMSIGMGVPLLLIGTTGGSWLPRAGVWMEAIKAIFGVLLLVVALVMLERVVPVAITMPLWAVLCIVCGIYLGALDVLTTSSGWQRLWKGVGVVFVAQGILVLIGAASGSEDPLQPLKFLRSDTLPSSVHVGEPPETNTAGMLSFQRVANSLELDQALATAESHPVLLDFYADWCVECKRMDQVTFADPAVRMALSEVILLRADVTKNTEADQALLRRFGLFGPPALLFFGSDGNERRDARIIGFADAAQLRARLEPPPGTHPEPGVSH